MSNTTALARIKEAEIELKQLDAVYAELASDASLTAASMAPPPAGTVADVVSIGRSLWKGDWGGALLDVVGIIPIVGDGIKGIAKGTKIAANMKDVEIALDTARAKLARKKQALMTDFKKQKAKTEEAIKNCSIQKCSEGRGGAKNTNIVKQKFDELKRHGHGPQRHEGDVTPKQLEERAVKGIDPMSGTTKDAVTRKTHRYSKNSTKVNSPEDYVKAEGHIKNSKEFEKAVKLAEDSGKNQIVVKESKLKEIYGSDYFSKVKGSTRVGSANNPEGVKDTIFTDESKMVGVYKKSTDGNWQLVTMYPDP